MIQKIEIQLNGVSQKDRNRLETEIDVLAGVADANMDENGRILIEFEDSETSQKRIEQSIEKMGYKLNGDASEIREHTYFVEGIHCSACEILIEKRLLNFKEVKSVDANIGSGEVFIKYQGRRPSAKKLSEIFKEEKYIFSDEPFSSIKNEVKGGFWQSFAIAGILIAGFLMLNKFGLSGLVNISSSSSLPTFFIFGILAGLSSCAALVGGIVLSMSKQWLEIYSDSHSTLQKLSPHLMFNIGRLISYAVLGGALGAIGSQLKLSATFGSFLIIAVSLLMLMLGLQMIGAGKFKRLQLAMPKFVSRYIADEKKFKGKYMPFVMGALTFFLPCGFTISAQGIALLSGSPIQGALIMFLFALGTAPALLVIGLSSIKFSSHPNMAAKFAKIAGFLVLFFALFNINNQLNVLGYGGVGDLDLFRAGVKTNISSSADESDLPQIINGKQILKMSASSSGYNPKYLKVRAGIPVRWEITDKGTSGCTNAIISRSLFSGQIPLTPGQVSVKEFTPKSPGKYKFSCWMGMVSGIIEVVDSDQAGFQVKPAAAANDEVFPSGAKGCGCGGGSGSSCGTAN